jgi:hypothetical protein
MEVMHRRFPNLYPDNLCRGCQEYPETNEHIWVCESAKPASSAIISVFMSSLILLLGDKAAELTPTLKCIPWWTDHTPPTLPALEAVLELQHTTTSMIMVGIIPSALIDYMTTLLTNGKKSQYELKRGEIAKKISKICNKAVIEARNTIWIPRCTESNAMDKAMGITPTNKKSVQKPRVWLQDKVKTPATSNIMRRKRKQPNIVKKIMCIICERLHTSEQKWCKPSDVSRVMGSTMFYNHSYGMKQLSAMWNPKLKFKTCQETEGKIRYKEAKKAEDARQKLKLSPEDYELWVIMTANREKLLSTNTNTRNPTNVSQTDEQHQPTPTEEYGDDSAMEREDNR